MACAINQACVHHGQQLRYRTGEMTASNAWLSASQLAMAGSAAHPMHWIRDIAFVRSLDGAAD